MPAGLLFLPIALPLLLPHFRFEKRHKNLTVHCSPAFENVKVRMQAGNQHLYRGTFDCIAAVLRDEGAAALYRGFNAHCLRNMLWWVRVKHMNMHNVWVVRH